LHFESYLKTMASTHLEPWQRLMEAKDTEADAFDREYSDAMAATEAITLKTKPPCMTLTAAEQEQAVRCTSPSPSPMYL